eukprot:1156572-Pelagomonas_calceolata.AAC.2
MDEVDKVLNLGECKEQGVIEAAHARLQGEAARSLRLLGERSKGDGSQGSARCAGGAWSRDVGSGQLDANALRLALGKESRTVDHS